MVEKEVEAEAEVEVEEEEEEDLKKNMIKEEEDQILSNEIPATLVDHAVTRGVMLRAAELRVQPNLGIFEQIVASVSMTFQQEKVLKN